MSFFSCFFVTFFNVYFFSQVFNDLLLCYTFILFLHSLSPFSFLFVSVSQFVLFFSFCVFLSHCVLSIVRYFFLPHLTFYLLCLFQLFSLCVSLSLSISLPSVGVFWLFLFFHLFVCPLSHLTFYLKNINFLSSFTFGISQLMMRIWFNGLAPHY